MEEVKKLDFKNAYVKKFTTKKGSTCTALVVVRGNGKKRCSLGLHLTL